VSFDLSIFSILHSLTGKSALLDFLIVFFAEYLPYLFLVVLLVFLYKIPRFRKRVYTFIFFALSGLVAKGVIVEVVRLFWDRSRPFRALDIVPLVIHHSPAFPSGHASFLFALAFAILYFNRSWGYVFLGAAFLNGIARVSAGLHWPSDIVGGIVTGAVSFGIVYVLLHKYDPDKKKEVG